MNTEIETPNSKLILHQIDDNINKLIEMSVLEVKTLLLVRPEINIYGKIVHQQRNVGFFSNCSKGYYYSNKLMKSQKLTLNLEKLLEYINTKFNSEYNGILINFYEDGTKYISLFQFNKPYLHLEFALQPAYKFYGSNWYKYLSEAL